MAIPAIIAGASALGGGIINAISEGNRRRGAAAMIRKNAEEMLRKQLESINQEQQFAQQGFEGGQKFIAQQARNAASGIFARAAQNRGRLLQQADAARRAGVNYDFGEALVNVDDNIEQGVSRVEQTRDASLNQSFQGYMQALQNLQKLRAAQQANYQNMLGQADSVEAGGNVIADFLAGAQTGAGLATSGLNLASAINASRLFPETAQSQPAPQESLTPQDLFTLNPTTSYLSPQAASIVDDFNKTTQASLGQKRLNDYMNMPQLNLSSPFSQETANKVDDFNQYQQNVLKQKQISDAANLFKLKPKLRGIKRRAMGGMVRAGEPVIVGDNPDGTLNETSEMIVPMQDVMVVPGREAQEMQQSAILRQQADLLIQDILDDKVLSKYFIGRYGKKKRK